MVSYFENDYAAPIILGDCKESITAARQIRKKTSLAVTVVSQKLSLINRIRFKHRRLTSDEESIILLTLQDAVRDMREYSTPLLICCEDHNSVFISKYRAELEQLYVIIPAKQINSYFESNE